MNRLDSACVVDLSKYSLCVCVCVQLLQPGPKTCPPGSTCSQTWTPSPTPTPLDALQTSYSMPNAPFVCVFCECVCVSVCSGVSILSKDPDVSTLPCQQPSKRNTHTDRH